MARPKTPRRRWADLGVYVHEWIWRFSQARGDAKFIFLYIGRFITRSKTGEWETPDPPTFEDIKDATDKSPSTIARSLKQLESAGDLEVVRGRGVVPKYRLRRQLDLLMDLRPPRPPSRGRLTHVTQTGVTTVTETAPSSQADGPLQSAGRGFGAVATAADVSSEVVRIEVPTTTEERAAAGFLDWFECTYREKRGNPHLVKRAAALDAVGRLLRNYPVEQLRTMARWMFAAERDEFIVGSDYSIFVLQHKAMYLADIVKRNKGRGPDGTLPAEQEQAS